MLFCVILVCILNRDFACMLNSERESYKELHRSSQVLPPAVPRPSISPPLTKGEAGDEKKELHCSSDISNNDDLEDTSDGMREEELEGFYFMLICRTFISKTWSTSQMVN